MKKFLPFLLSCFVAGPLFAQDVKLSDSVIFINDKPVALFLKTNGHTANHYNTEVYGFDGNSLIKAEAIRFNAPVSELKPFYYYELTFAPTADTFAMYVEDENMPMVLAKIIRDYNLINKNELNNKNIAGFMNHYSGGPALLAKIKSFEDYLAETRHFDEQEKRDRTKPVTIVNDRVIMQDGVKIGMIVTFQNYTESSVPAYVTSDTSNYRARPVVHYQDVTTISEETNILFANGRKIEPNGYYNKWISGEIIKKKNSNQKLVFEKDLYKISIAANKNISSKTDQLLIAVCALIEDYAL